MVNKLTRKAILSIKKNIDMYGEEMSKLQEKIAVIDEKYRKMAEDAKKDLTIAYSNLESEQEIWQSSLSRYDEDTVNEVLGECTSTTEVNGDGPDLFNDNDENDDNDEKVVDPYAEVDVNNATEETHEESPAPVEENDNTSSGDKPNDNSPESVGEELWPDETQEPEQTPVTEAPESNEPEPQSEEKDEPVEVVDAGDDDWPTISNW